MSVINELGDELYRGISSALSGFGRALNAAGTATVRTVNEFGRESKRCITGTMRISYNALGDHTFPIDSHPPAASEISTAGWILCFPLELASIAASLTIFPVVGNSIQVLPKSFSTFANIGLVDLPANQQFQNTVQHDNRTLIRHLYGIPGYGVGGLIGLGVAGIIISGRVVTNSAVSIMEGINFVTHHTINNVNEQQAEAEGQAARTIFSQFLGLPGFFVGLAIGGTFSVIYNNLISLKRGFVTGVNIGLDHRDIHDQAADERKLPGKTIGGLSYLLGLGIGLISTSIVILARVITNSFKSFGMGYNLVVDFFDGTVRPEGVPIDPALQRSIVSPVLGTPGVVLGFLVGVTSAFISHGCRSFAIGFLNVINFAFDNRDAFDIPNDNHRPLAAKIIGFPGLVAGAAVGSLAALGVLVGRVFTNSFKSFTTAYVSIDDFFENRNRAADPNEENRTIFSKFLGLPGLGFGYAFGLTASFISHSIQSFAHGFIWSMNLGLDSTDASNSVDGRCNAAKRLGYLGFAAGVVAGGVMTIVTLLGRIITNSIKSFEPAYSLVTDYFTNAPVINNNQQQVAVPAERTTLSKFLGIPGFIAGFVVGSLTSFISHTIHSLGYGYVGAFNLGLDRRDRIDNNDARSLRAKRLGFLGFGIGGIFGLVTAGGIMLTRLLTNSFKSYDQGYRKINSYFEPTLPPADAIPGGPAVPRSTLSEALGIPGYIIGGVMSFFAALVKNTILSIKFGYLNAFHWSIGSPTRADDARTDASKRLGILGLLSGTVVGLMTGLIYNIYRATVSVISNTITSFAKGFLAPLEFFDQPNPNAINNNLVDRTPWQKAQGCIGYVFGFTLGAMSAFIYHSCVSLGRGFIFAANLGLDERDRIINDNDGRINAAKVLGTLGWILGAGFGCLAGLAIVAGRVITNSVKSFISAYDKVTNFFNIENSNIPAENRRLAHSALYPRSIVSHFLGSAGYALGLVAGSISAFISHSCQSLAHGFMTVARYGFDSSDRSDAPVDARTNAAKRLGTLGLIFGAGLGFIAAGFVILARVVTNSVKSFISGYELVRNYFNNVAPANANAPAPAPRSFLSKSLGIVGMGLGLIVGFGVSLISETYTSLIRGFTQGINLGLDAEDKNIIVADGRTLAAKRLGKAGWVIGAGAGAIAAIGVLIGRIFTNTIKSCVPSFLAVTRYFDAIDQPIANNAAAVRPRSTLSQVLGAPGVFFGGGFGLAFSLFANTIKSVAYGFIAALNVVDIGKDQAYTISDDTRRSAGKYLGVLGYVAGAMAGIFAGIGMNLLRVLKNTYLSFEAMTGQCVNAAFQKQLMGGFATDTRTDTQKRVGFLGYVLAAPLVPLSLVTNIACLKLPLLPFFLIGLAAAPFIFIGKSIEKLCGVDKRFDAPTQPRGQGELEIKGENDVMQGFKNIYSSLNWRGQFKPGQNIELNGDGQEKPGSFAFKVFTFNMNTITERTLKILLERYQATASRDEGGFGANFFSKANMGSIALELKGYYRDTAGCLTTDEELARTEQEVDNIVDFVRAYINDHIVGKAFVPVPQGLYPPGGPSWSATMFNRAQQPLPSAPAADEENQPGMVPEMKS